jgi:hypothetical protein
MRRLAILIAAVLALPVLAPAASAEPVQEFNVQLKDVRADGRYTIVFSSNSYDTSGEQPPVVTSNDVRFAAGVTIRKEFLTPRYRCDVPRLRDVLVDNPEAAPVMSKRVDQLPATLKRIRDDITPNAARIVETCIRAQIGKGIVVADTRPFIADPIPAKLFLYLSKATAKGAIASFGVLAVLDESSKPYKEIGLLQSLGPLSFTTNVFNEPSADGVYGYRLALPSGPVGIVKISLAELRVTTPGITAVKDRVTCARRSGGTCRKRKVTKQRTFWLTQPTCPASSTLGFEASYVYETGQAMTKTQRLPCPRFQR